MKLFLIALVLSTGMTFASSPDDSTYTVKTKADLVACNSSKEGFLAYVQDESRFYVCSDGQWK